MIMVQLKNILGALVKKSLGLYILFFICFDGYANNDFADGVAIEPMELVVNPNKVTNFTVYNNTDREFVLVQKVVISDENTAETNPPFVVNPPIQLIKKRSDITMGLIYTTAEHKKEDNIKYYLSVSFIPKTKKEHEDLSVPIVLKQQIPIKFS